MITRLLVNNAFPLSFILLLSLMLSDFRRIIFSGSVGQTLERVRRSNVVAIVSVPARIDRS